MFYSSSSKKYLWETVMTLFFSVPKTQRKSSHWSSKQHFYITSLPVKINMGECQPSLFPASELSMGYPNTIFLLYSGLLFFLSWRMILQISKVLDILKVEVAECNGKRKNVGCMGSWFNESFVAWILWYGPSTKNLRKMNVSILHTSPEKSCFHQQVHLW